MYCGALWYDSANTAMNKLKIVYHSASEMFVCLNIQSIDKLNTLFFSKFKIRLIPSSNYVN